MEKISQKIEELISKLSDRGLKNRAAQFEILADELKEEIKLKKFANFNKIDVDSLRKLK